MDAQTPAQRLDTLSVLSLVLSIAAFMTVWCCIGYPIGLIAVVLGAVAISRNSSGGYSGTSRVLAFSGIGITAFAIFLHVILIAVGQVSKPELPGSEKTATTSEPVAAAPVPVPSVPAAPPVAEAPPAPPEPVAPPPPPADPLPSSQQAFCDAVKMGADGYQAAQSDGANQLKLSKLRTVRKSAVASAVKGGAFKDWVGTVDGLQTTGDGKAILSIKLTCEADVKVSTWNNTMSDIMDNTLISQSSSLYDAIAEFGEGAKVKVSGKFASGDVDGFRESSMTESGSMTDPDYKVRFSGISAR